MREGSPLLALERGEQVRTPPVLWVQSIGDLIHDYTDPTSGFAGSEANRFLDRYRRAGGEAEIAYFDAPLHFTTGDPSLPASITALDRLVAFVKRHVT